jgi:hypothetical protein
MKAYLSQLSPFTLVILSIPALVLIHTVLSVLAPAVIREMVPESIRAVLHTL